MTRAYGTRFFDAMEEGSRRSAEVVVAVLSAYARPESVVDVGCGLGTWLAAWQDEGVDDVLGIDGEWVDRDSLHIPATDFVSANLAESLELGRRFDLAMSLEVAEHLPEGSAPTFITSLSELADAVLFSAAVPRQGGTNHVNEQWPAYWARLFAERSFSCYDVLRPRLWEDERVDFWYRQNVLLFIKDRRNDHYASMLREALDAQPATPRAIVHPEAFLYAHDHLSRRQAPMPVSPLRRAARRLPTGMKAHIRRWIGSP